MTGNYDEETLKELREGDDFCEYYTLLNVDKAADLDEIKKSYRRLCRIYHPDRYQDESKQKSATEFFRRIQEAYKVLSDPRKRSIYDKRGRVGLSDDMALIERTSLPSELLEEYEKLRELWEERSYIQDSHPRGDFRMHVDATPLIDGRNWYKDGQGLVTLEKFQLEQSVDARITKSAFSQITGLLSVQRLPQHVFGGIQVSLRQLYSNQNWVKVSALINNRPVIGLDGYHTINENMYVTGQSSFALTNRGNIRFGANVGITRRLTNTTTGTISIRELGNVTVVKVVHNVSATTNLIGSVSVSKDSSFVKGLIQYRPFSQYLLKAGVQGGTTGLSVLYGIEHEVAKLTTIGGVVLVGPNQGVVLKLKLTRALMNFGIRIRLSDYIGVAAIFYATTIPLVLYGCIKVLAIAPLLRKERMQEIREKKSERAKEILKRKKMAEAAIELMQETVERIINTEQARHGLLIVEGWYGKLIDHESDDGLLEPKVIDVRIPLQCLVVDSKLILREANKANIPGFF